MKNRKRSIGKENKKDLPERYHIAEHRYRRTRLKTTRVPRDLVKGKEKEWPITRVMRRS